MQFIIPFHLKLLNCSLFPHKSDTPKMFVSNSLPPSLTKAAEALFFFCGLKYCYFWTSKRLLVFYGLLVTNKLSSVFCPSVYTHLFFSRRISWKRSLWFSCHFLWWMMTYPPNAHFYLQSAVRYFYYCACVYAWLPIFMKF